MVWSKRRLEALEVPNAPWSSLDPTTAVINTQATSIHPDHRRSRQPHRIIGIESDHNRPRPIRGMPPHPSIRPPNRRRGSMKETEMKASNRPGIERLEVIDLTDPTGPDVDLMEMGENGCSAFVERVLRWPSFHLAGDPMPNLLRSPAVPSFDVVQ